MQAWHARAGSRTSRGAAGRSRGGGRQPGHRAHRRQDALALLLHGRQLGLLRPRRRRRAHATERPMSALP